MANNVEKIVLRYRDLSSKNTIESHKSIITEYEYVWWGWWAKPQEKVDLETFAELKKRAQDEGIDIFLLDSGKEELRSAKCIDIEFATTGDYIKSPDKKKTPKYYNKNEYMIWFKLSYISDVMSNGNEIINDYSYLKNDEHFASRISPFAAFENKKVFNLSELIEQQCTIWYLRKAKESDEHRRIVSYAPGSGNFDNWFSIDETNRLIWFSDLHFSTKHHAFQNTIGSNNSLFNVIREKLDSIEYKKFSRILVTGDFTFESSVAEFKQAQHFFEEFSSVYSIGGAAFAFCPGNHDMEYAKEEYTDESKVVLTYDEAKRNYIDFYERIREITANKYINTMQRFITVSGKLVELICINTCILQQDGSHFRGMGFAGNDQLRELKKLLKQTEKMNAVRILAMHHNMLPVVYSEKPQVNPMYSILLDSEAISQFCVENNISVVLHGHTHKEFYTEVTRKSNDGNKKTIYVIGLGSTGAVKEDLSEESNNQFATVQFEKSCIRISIYPISPTGGNSNKEYIVEHIIPYGE